MRKCALVLVILALLCGPLASWSDSTAADLVLRGGAVYTMDAPRSWADAVAVSHGRIVYVGSTAGVASFVGASTRVIDLKGRMVLPGFHDSHVHGVVGGFDLGLCRLDSLKTSQQVFDAIRRYAAAHPRDAWVIGNGWDLPLFPRGNPTRQQLDRLVPERPAYMEAADGHSAWANSMAMRVAGLTARTPDPKGGRIEREANGMPSGTLREDAMELVKSHVPRPTPEESQAGLRRYLKMANGYGITSLMDADAGEQFQNGAEDGVLNTYAALDAQGELSARVVTAMHFDPDRGLAQIPELVEKRKSHQTSRLRANAVKIFADGVIESHTAALLRPYTDQPGNRGHLNLTPEVLARDVVALDREGFQVHVHTIGDGAVRATLDAFQAALKANGRRDSRHHMAHLELVDPVDIPRFRELGVLANFQPFWAYADNYILDLTNPLVGKERASRLYPMGSVARTGAVIVAGSDWDVSSMNPLDGIQVAVTRQPPDNPHSPPWLPNERLDLPTVLAAYTINGAYVNFEEHETGSVEVGKAADLIVLDHNLFTIPVFDIHKVKVLLTLLEGKAIFTATSFAANMP